MVVWRDDWSNSAVLQIIAATHDRMKVVVLAGDGVLQDEARAALREFGVPPGAVKVSTAPTNSVWIRDYGPAVIETASGQFALMDTLYSEDRFLDDRLPGVLSSMFRMPVVRCPIRLEGGALLCNGSGLCLVSEMVLELNRRLGFDEPQVTEHIKRLAGVEEVVYLEPLDGEPTAHIDWFATFVAPNTVVVGDYQNQDSPNARLLDEHAERLCRQTTPDGPLKVVRIPMPPPEKGAFGGTYTNVVYANGVLLVPTWTDSEDATLRETLDVYRRLLPDWKIVTIDSRQLGRCHGSLHCAVMNLHRLDPVSPSTDVRAH